MLASGRMASVQSRDNLAVKALKAVAKFFCTAYVEVFRATPMLVQVFIIYYGLGNVFKLSLIHIFRRKPRGRGWVCSGCMITPLAFPAPPLTVRGREKAPVLGRSRTPGG